MNTNLCLDHAQTTENEPADCTTEYGDETTDRVDDDLNKHVLKLISFPKVNSNQGFFCVIAVVVTRKISARQKFLGRHSQGFFFWAGEGSYDLKNFEISPKILDGVMRIMTLTFLVAAFETLSSVI